MLARKVFTLSSSLHVNWFPGHMAKASRDIIERASTSDCIIELRDARAPFSTANETLAEDPSVVKVPRLIVLNKADLATDIAQRLSNNSGSINNSTRKTIEDYALPNAPHRVVNFDDPQSWVKSLGNININPIHNNSNSNFIDSLDTNNNNNNNNKNCNNNNNVGNDDHFFHADSTNSKHGKTIGVMTLTSTGRSPTELTRRVLRAASLLSSGKGKWKGKGTPRVFSVIGMPNVGKSTLINTMRRGAGMGKKGVAKVENRPGVTRSVSAFKVMDCNDMSMMLQNHDSYENFDENRYITNNNNNNDVNSINSRKNRRRKNNGRNGAISNVGKDDGYGSVNKPAQQQQTSSKYRNDKNSNVSNNIGSNTTSDNITSKYREGKRASILDGGADLFIWDSPGVMVTKVKDDKIGLNLALLGCVRPGTVHPIILAEYLLFMANNTRGKDGWKRAYGPKSPINVPHRTDDISVVLNSLRKRKSMTDEECADAWVAMFRKGDLGKWTIDNDHIDVVIDKENDDLVVKGMS